jgi:hypothetical protein
MGTIIGNELVDISGNGNNIVVTGIDFASGYIPSTSAATFAIPNVVALKTDDTDLFWADAGGNILQKSVTNLTEYDYARTIIKYDDSAPYNVRWIAILKSAAVLTADQLSKLYASFDLWLYWSGGLNADGIIKGNRNIPGSIPVMPTGLTLTLISGGVQIDWTDESLGQDETEIWGRSDAGISALLYTTGITIVTKNDLTIPVDLRYYKLRSKNGSVYSSFTVEESIAMLGAEKVTAGDMTDATKFAVLGTLWTIAGGVASCNNSADGHFIQLHGNMGSNTEVNKTYRASFDIDIVGGNANFGFVDESLTQAWGAYEDYPDGHHTYIFSIVANIGDGGLAIYLSHANTDNAFTLDNLSLKEVLFP